MELVVALRRGSIRCVYDEAIALNKLGCVAIERASHVEPDSSGAWWADLAPVGGPRLGPYERRGDALAAERSWLQAYVAASLPLSA